MWAQKPEGLRPWHPLCFVMLCYVFRVVGSNGAISGYNKSKLAAGRHLG